jgi:hypothetical protein
MIFICIQQIQNTLIAGYETIQNVCVYDPMYLGRRSSNQCKLLLDILLEEVNENPHLVQRRLRTSVEFGVLERNSDS